MKMQWAQILMIIFVMYYLSACERDANRENNRIMKESFKELTQEVKNVKSELLNANMKLNDLKIQLIKFHSDVNVHNLKVERKTL